MNGHRVLVFLLQRAEWGAGQVLPAELGPAGEHVHAQVVVGVHEIAGLPHQQTVLVDMPHGVALSFRQPFIGAGEDSFHEVHIGAQVGAVAGLADGIGQWDVTLAAIDGQRAEYALGVLAVLGKEMLVECFFQAELEDHTFGLFLVATGEQLAVVTGLWVCFLAVVAKGLCLRRIGIS